MSLVDTFTGAVLPVVAIAGVGFLLGRRLDVDTGGLNSVVLYVLAPALVLHSLSTTDVAGGAILRLAVGVVAVVVAMTLVGELVARALGIPEPFRSALVLVAAYPNSGNYGIPLSEFAFGAVGRSTAIVFLSVQSVLVYTLGAYVASRSGGDAGLAGVRRVLRIPLVYAVVVALAARYLGVVPPEAGTAMSTLELVGNAAIPVMLLLLGIELSSTDYRRALSKMGPPTVLKMAVAPAVGIAIALALGFSDPVVARTFVLETATPAAVTPLILILEFGSDRTVDGITVGEYVSTAVLVTTVLSVLTLTGVIAVLQSGLFV